MKSILQKLGFDKKSLTKFLIVVTNSQLVYAFIALKSVLYEPMVEALGVSNTQFGVLLGIIGLTVYGNIIFGWVQDRFSTRKILSINSFIYGLLGLYIAVSPPNPLPILFFIFFTMGMTSEALYWPSVLKSVRSIATDKTQATAFGFMEFIRGVWEFIINAVAVTIFALLGSTIFGMKVAMGFAAVTTIISALSVWFFVDEEEVLVGAENKTKVAFEGLIKAMKMPEVWLIGLSASCVYASFVAVNTYFVPFLQNVYLLPVALVGIFGLVNASVIRFIAGPLAGVIADSKFKSSAHLMRFCYIFLIVCYAIALVIPKETALVIPAMILLLCISLGCFFIRGVYYAPIGELGIPTDMSAAAMSVAAAIGYSPQFWGYPLFGFVIDYFGAEKGYIMIFVILLIFASIGAILTTLIGRKIVKNRS